MNSLLTCLSAAGLAGLLASLSSPTTSAPTAAEAYSIDTVHSAVVFETKHMGISMAHGRFNTISAEQSKLTFDKDLAKSSILLVVDAASVDTNDEKRDEHLRNADFFSAKEFPEIVFESKKITGTEKDFQVAGELTFHGVTKPVTAKGRMIGSGEAFGGFRAGFEASFTIDLADFDIAMVKKNPGAVGPEVELTVSLECVRN